MNIFMKDILDALNAYATLMRMDENYCPVVIRSVTLDDVLQNDKLVTNDSITDIAIRIEKGYFTSGNHFALSEEGEIVYCNEKVAQNINCLYFWITERTLEKTMALYKDIKSN